MNILTKFALLTPDEGGGFLITYPDFSICISDGETVEEAIINGRDALIATIEALRAENLPIPAPNSRKGTDRLTG